MKHVGPVRKKLAHPTIFNILGPLANPAGAPFQLLGVGRPELRPLLAEALAMLGTRRTLVVHGSDGLDEVTLAGATEVTEAAGGALREFEWTPGRLRPGAGDREPLLVDGPAAERRGDPRHPRRPAGRAARRRGGQRGGRPVDAPAAADAGRSAPAGGRGHRQRRRPRPAGPAVERSRRVRVRTNGQ